MVNEEREKAQGKSLLVKPKNICNILTNSHQNPDSARLVLRMSESDKHTLISK